MYILMGGTGFFCHNVSFKNLFIVRYLLYLHGITAIQLYYIIIIILVILVFILIFIFILYIYFIFIIYIYI